MSSDNHTPLKLSVIIPALNEARALGATLDALNALSGAPEVILVDGGSSDETLRLARARGVRVISAARGRGVQMNAGARAAQGDVLWFLHADTQPPADAATHIAAALDDANTVGGNFEIEFDGASRAARFMTWLYPKLRRLGLSYGDSAIFVRREAYERAGGFQPFPLFEDVDFVRRLKRSGRFAHLSSSVKTSSRRFEGRSFTLTFARWAILQALYWAGVPPASLNRFYTHIRHEQRTTRS